MRKVKVIADSCADLNVEQLNKYGIAFAKMSTSCDGVESVATLLWTDEEAHEHYNKMRDGKRIITAQVSVEEFQRVFEEYLKQDMDIVYIGCSSKQSGSVNTGFVTAKKLMEKYEGSTIICIDSLNASMGEGMLAIEAAKLANDGASATEIEAHILSIRKKVNQYVTVHSLDALKRAGRVKGSAAFFGNLMGVKPIIIADANGAQAAYNVLMHYGINNVKIEKTSGRLSDHFDPRANVIRLSPEVFDGNSIAAVGIACHEAGHAAQHAQAYFPIKVRNAVIPLTRIGSTAGIFLTVLGLVFSFEPLVSIGLLLYFFIVVFQLVTLPVEFNASRRAVRVIDETNMLSAEELPAVKKVLSAAAMTYVAALIVAVAQFLRLFLRANNRRR